MHGVRNHLQYFCRPQGGCSPLLQTPCHWELVLWGKCRPCFYWSVSSLLFKYTKSKTDGSLKWQQKHEISISYLSADKENHIGSTNKSCPYSLHFSFLLSLNGPHLTLGDLALCTLNWQTSPLFPDMLRWWKRLSRLWQREEESWECTCILPF